MLVLLILAHAWFSKSWLVPSTILMITIALQIIMIFTFSTDPAYYHSRIDLQAAEQQIAGQYSPGDLVLVKSYATPAWYYWMNWADPRLPWTSLPFYFPAPAMIDQYNADHDPGVLLDTITLSLFKTLPGAYRRAWLVLPDDSRQVGCEVAWLSSVSQS